jgi:hypothetical protein
MKIIVIVIFMLSIDITNANYFSIKRNECIREKEIIKHQLTECQNNIFYGIYALTNIACADNKAIDLPFYLKTKRKKCVDVKILTNQILEIDAYEESCEFTLHKDNKNIKQSLKNCKDIKEQFEQLATIHFCSVGTSLDWINTAKTSYPSSQIKQGPQCFVCGEDHFRSKNMFKCSKCPAGYIANNDKNDKCFLCTQEMFKNNECERPSDEFCDYNHKLANYHKYTDNTISCIHCDQPGTFNKNMNHNFNCDKCQDVYIYDYNYHKCNPCPIGTFQENNNCIQCPKNTFNDKIGNNHCYPITDQCPSDTIANFPGATHCNSETFIEKIKRLWYIIFIILFIIIFIILFIMFITTTTGV